MPRIDRRTRQRRLGALVVGVVLLLAVVLGVRWGCGGDDTASTGGDGAGLFGKVTQVKLGEQVTLGDASLKVAAFTPTAKPVRPAYPLDESVPGPAAAGETYYQAFVVVDNKGPSTFRFDPDDFDLLLDGTPVAPDPVWTGPSARTLLPGASLSATIGFRAPVAQNLQLRWRPTGTGATLLFIGTRKPEGMAFAPYPLPLVAES